MPNTTPHTSLLELQTDLWKTRALAKQKWLHRTLAEPSRTPGDAQLRSTWIQEALHAVKRGQDELKYQSALLDVYAAHLRALEKSLVAAHEQHRDAEADASHPAN